MYSKVFRSIYDGSLAATGEPLVTFLLMLPLADRGGIVDIRPKIIAALSGMPEAFIWKGIETLEAPDPESHSPDEEGRRIVRLDPDRKWGWRIVNYAKYRGIRTYDDRAEYQREYQKERRQKGNGVNQNKPDVNQNKPQSTIDNPPRAIAEAEAEAEAKKNIGQTAAAFDRFWERYPKKRKKKQAFDLWKRKHLDPLAERILEDVENRKVNDRRWVEGYIPDPPVYLGGQRWEDEVEGTADPFEGAI